jgi:hypothetical protein
MARYKLVEYQGEWYGLRRGETLEQLLQMERIDFPSSPRTDVKSNYWISIGYGCLFNRAYYRRCHHKIRPADSQKPRPKFGPGSGKAGGGRGAKHVTSHLKYWPGTTVFDCPVCQRGLTTVLREQDREHTDPKFADRPWYDPREHEAHQWADLAEAPLQLELTLDRWGFHPPTPWPGLIDDHVVI